MKGLTVQLKGQKDNTGKYQLKFMDIDIWLQNEVYSLLIRLSFSFCLNDFRKCRFKSLSKSYQIAAAAKQMLNVSLTSSNSMDKIVWLISKSNIELMLWRFSVEKTTLQSIPGKLNNVFSMKYLELSACKIKLFDI